MCGSLWGAQQLLCSVERKVYITARTNPGFCFTWGFVVGFTSCGFVVSKCSSRSGSFFRRKRLQMFGIITIKCLGQVHEHFLVTKFCFYRAFSILNFFFFHPMTFATLHFKSNMTYPLYLCKIRESPLTVLPLLITDSCSTKTTRTEMEFNNGINFTGDSTCRLP